MEIPKVIPPKLSTTGSVKDGDAHEYVNVKIPQLNLSGSEPTGRPAKSDPPPLTPKSPHVSTPLSPKKLQIGHEYVNVRKMSSKSPPFSPRKLSSTSASSPIVLPIDHKYINTKASVVPNFSLTLSKKQPKKHSPSGVSTSTPSHQAPQAHEYVNTKLSTDHPKHVPPKLSTKMKPSIPRLNLPISTTTGGGISAELPPPLTPKTPNASITSPPRKLQVDHEYVNVTTKTQKTSITSPPKILQVDHEYINVKPASPRKISTKSGEPPVSPRRSPSNKSSPPSSPKVDHEYVNVKEDHAQAPNDHNNKAIKESVN